MLAFDGDCPDPYLLRTAGGFLCFATGTAGLHLQVLAAPAPTGPWTRLGDPLAALPPWAAPGRTWSPAVLATGDGFVLYAAVHERSSGRQVLATFTASAAEGPYVPVGGPLMRMTSRGGAIDPDPYVAADGSAVLTWKSDDNADGRTSSLWGRRLRPDGLGFAGRFGRARRLLRHDAAWERPLVEAPCVVAGDDGGCVLLYSGGPWESAAYGVGWARADHPLGPWTKVSTGRPWLGSDAEVAGPGGQSVVVDAGGRRWLAFHGWEPGRVGYARGGRRALHVRPLTVDTAGPRWAP